MIEEGKVPLNKIIRINKINKGEVNNLQDYYLQDLIQVKNYYHLQQHQTKYLMVLKYSNLYLVSFLKYKIKS